MGVGCGDAIEFDPEDLNVDVSSQELRFQTYPTKLTSFNLRTLQLRGLVYQAPPDPGAYYTFSLKTLGFAGLKAATSYQTISTRSGTLSGDTCGTLAMQWRKVLNRKDRNAAKKRQIIFNGLLPKMVKNGCTADITYVKGFHGVNQVKGISFPAKPRVQ